MERRFYEGEITELPENGVFVFGANTQGRHGKGAAKTALDKFDAEYGNAFGPQNFEKLGSSFRSFAITTKDLERSIHPSVPERLIISMIKHLYLIANDFFRHKDFYIAYSGTGTNLNGYTPQEMANMFNQPPIPENIIFEREFLKLIQNG